MGHVRLLVSTPVASSGADSLDGLRPVKCGRSGDPSARSERRRTDPAFETDPARSATLPLLDDDFDGGRLPRSGFVDVTDPTVAGTSLVPTDRSEPVPLGLRWFDDAFAIAPTAGAFATRLADMTNAKAALRILRSARISATVAHLIVRASALVLARSPQLHETVCNYRRVTPGAVDIGLSVAGETTYAPVVVIRAANQIPLSKLVPHVIDSIDAGLVKEKVDLANMRKYMWLIPFRFLRRFFIRRMTRSFWFRRRIAGTFQVTILPSSDVAVPLLFYTGAILGAGGVRDRVVALDGNPVVRPTMWLTIAFDHGSLDGVRAGELLEAIKDCLEGDELIREAQEAAAVTDIPRASSSSR